ncbi:MAG: DUF934 domain-containing protein [Rhodospirillales bacterium]|nr:DUF934 domain-containing protein [Rhodospirillales bacterium]
MPLIDYAGRVLADPWRFLADDEVIPERGPIAVSLARWQAERNALLQHPGPLGLVLKSHETAGPIAGDLEKFALIVLEFPKFTDGRPYSTARLLRERHGYSGELRALGVVLRDQLQFLKRCGFDSFVLAKEAAAEDLVKALKEITVAYQHAADGTPRAAERTLRDRTGYEDSKICVAYWAY